MAISRQPGGSRTLTMDWVLEHLQIVIAIAVVIAAAVQKWRQARTQSTAEPPAQANPEEAARTRRIQEDIRRRILERRGLAPAASVAEDERPGFPEAPAPVFEDREQAFPSAPPMIEEVRPLVVPPPVLVPMAMAPAADDLSEAKRQRELVQRLRELELAANRRAAPTGVAAVPVPAAAGGGLRALLRSPAGLRQAIMLREIVDPPLGLRPPETPGQGIWTRM
jgi:hypothetical protein